MPLARRLDISHFLFRMLASAMARHCVWQPAASPNFMMSYWLPAGLRSTQLSILTAIARAARPTISEIANAMVIDRSALAHNLKPLERSGLVRIIADEGDKRSRLIVLTTEGRAKLSEALPLWEEAQRSFRAAFGTKNAEAMRTSLNILTSADFARAFQGGKKD